MREMTKKIFDLDLDRCVGCFACVVACMDQNDIVPTGGNFMRREVSTMTAKGKIQYASLACMHCSDAPCVVSCPTGALFKDEATNLIETDKAKCVGCHSCVMSCPFGAPTFDKDGKLEKCDGCQLRVEHGLIPACVRTCPTKALRFATVEEIQAGKKMRSLRKALDA